MSGYFNEGVMLVEASDAAATSAWVATRHATAFTIETLFDTGTVSVVLEGTSVTDPNATAPASLRKFTIDTITARGITTYTGVVPWVRVRATPAGGATLNVVLNARDN